MSEPGLYGINEKSTVAQVLSNKMAGTKNMEGIEFTNFRADPNINRPAEYHLHVFNIAQREFTIRRPPLFPCIKIPACPLGQPYILVAKIPNIVNEKYIISESGKTANQGRAGELVANDLVNPANTSGDMWREINDENITWIDGGTDDATRRGLFWTRNETPTEEELHKAKERMQRHYKGLLSRAETLSRQNKIDEISWEMHLAADHFRIRSTWHTVAELPEECPNCGEGIKPGVAFHTLANGALCVVDWRRAVAAGVVRKEDVPDGQVPEDEPVHRGPGRPRKEQ